jgi:pimeloyl-ACP methyl ester carboxylesterase
MPGKRVAVLIPGILGSVLEDSAGGQIWGEDFHKNYTMLLGNPGLIAWNGQKARARLLKIVRFGDHWYSPKDYLWEAICTKVAFPTEFGNPTNIIEVGYDWRQSNVTSAGDVASFLSRCLGSPLSRPPPPAEERRLTVIMHSMGGLVARIAVARGLIHPRWIDRLLHIGSPLYGAQSAFGSLFGAEDILPLISLLVSARRLKNRDRFLQFLQTCIRSCPSIYELLPRRQIPYLRPWVDRGSSPITNRLTNPLNENYIDPALVAYAVNAHALLDKACTTLSRAKIPSFTIYTHSHPSLKTEIEFFAQAQQGGYRVVEVTGLTSFGDGTVPSDSARGDMEYDRPIPVYGVKHAAMCKDWSVSANVQANL